MYIQSIVYMNSIYRGVYREITVHLLDNILFCLYLGKNQGVRCSSIIWSFTVYL